MSNHRRGASLEAAVARKMAKQIAADIDQRMLDDIVNELLDRQD